MIQGINSTFIHSASPHAKFKGESNQKPSLLSSDQTVEQAILALTGRIPGSLVAFQAMTVASPRQLNGLDIHLLYDLDKHGITGGKIHKLYVACNKNANHAYAVVEALNSGWIDKQQVDDAIHTEDTSQLNLSELHLRVQDKFDPAPQFVKVFKRLFRNFLSN